MGTTLILIVLVFVIGIVGGVFLHKLVMKYSSDANIKVIKVERQEKAIMESLICQ